MAGVECDPRRGKRGRQGGELRAVQPECTLARPPWVTAGCFSLHGSGELSGVAFILESQIDFWTAGIPYHCRCIVAGRLLAGHKTLKNDLHTLQFVTADRSVSLGYSAYDEMGSRLAVLE